MNQNLTETVFGISAQLPAIYTAAHFFCGIPMLKSVLLKNVPQNVSDELILCITGTIGDVRVIDFTVSIPDFSAADYVCADSHAFPLNLERYRILPEAEFINNFTAKISVKIQVSVSFAGYTASDFASVKLLPLGQQSFETTPELLCAYVLPGCDFAGKVSKTATALSKEIASARYKNAPGQIPLSEAIFSVILEEKLTYLATMREAYDAECTLRSPDEVLASNIKSVSLTEAALIYCSCAERCRLHPSIIYLRKGAGSVRVLIGIELKPRSEKIVIGESISELRERILAKEIFVFDVLGLLGTEDTDFSRNVTETTALVFKTSSSLAFSADVFAARACGIGSLRPHTGTGAGSVYGSFESIADSIKKIETCELDNILHGYSPYSTPSLGLAVPKEALTDGATYTLAVLDDEIFTLEPDTISLITSFDGNYPAEKARNNSEQAQYLSRLESLRQKLNDNGKKGILHAYPAGYILKCEKPVFERTRDEFAQDTAKILEEVKLSEIKGGGKSVYAIMGIVELSVKDETLFVPCMYVPCKLTQSDGSLKLTYKTEKAIFNRSLYNYLLESYSLDEDALIYNSDACDSDCIEIFRDLVNKCDGKIKLHSDILLSCFDLSYTFMRECLEGAEGKRFEKYIESGKYDSESDGQKISGRLESTLPFDCPSNLRRAVKCAEKDSVIITGPSGSGKKKAVANIISRAALCGTDVLVCSKHGDSLYALYETMEEAMLGELCLVAGDSRETKNKIIRDLEKKEKEPDIPAVLVRGDISSLESELAIYEDELYCEYGFGYSLYDCVNEYCKYDLEAPATPIEADTEIGNLSKEGAKELFEISRKLSENALTVSEALGGASISSCGLEHIRTTAEVRKSYATTLVQALHQLNVFREKSSFARTTLGLSDKAITDLRALVALGEFFDLIIKSGIDYIPDELLGTGTYRKAGVIEKACEILRELSEIDARLSEVNLRIPSAFCTELYHKWCDAENNPFVKNSISHELKKYLPEKIKLSSKEIGELLELLCRREALESELSEASEEASSALGSVWCGRNTDTEKARRICSFALSADNCIKRIFRNGNDRLSDMQGGLSQLISSLIEDKSENANFVLALAALKKLMGENAKSGLLYEISETLSVDLYDIKFQNGILGEDGICSLFDTWSKNARAIRLIPEYNAVKKSAISKGLSKFVSALEDGVSKESGMLLSKSLFAAFARYIILGKDCFSKADITEKYAEYRELYFAEKKLAAYNLLSLHRKKFSDYVSSPEGKSELYALRESLADKSVTTHELISRHSLILREMYSALLMQSTDAYRLKNYPQTLVLFDSEQTTAAQALPLCANFDKCIFISTPFENGANILSALPLGIPQIKLTDVLCEKNGHIAAFISDMFYGGNRTCIRETDSQSVRLVKCTAGLYDKNSCTNKIEAVMACETALLYAKEYGFDKVGIVAFTPNQVLEINQSLLLLSNKYSDSRISEIPARYIGSLGDFSKDYVVLCVTFGKNIYSITRSFGLLDDAGLLLSGSPSVLGKLLCAKKSLIVVSSLEPEEIPQDGAMSGAAALRKLLGFAKYCAAHNAASAENSVSAKLEKDFLPEADSRFTRRYDGVTTVGDVAFMYENGYIKDAYDRIILPEKEFTSHGYTTKYVSINEILKYGQADGAEEITSEKREMKL